MMATCCISSSLSHESACLFLLSDTSSFTAHSWHVFASMCSSVVNLGLWFCGQQVTAAICFASSTAIQQILEHVGRLGMDHWAWTIGHGIPSCGTWPFKPKKGYGKIKLVLACYHSFYYLQGDWELLHVVNIKGDENRIHKIVVTCDKVLSNHHVETFESESEFDCHQWPMIYWIRDWVNKFRSPPTLNSPFLNSHWIFSTYFGTVLVL